jgi:predicted Zn-dependent peptidase
VAFRKTNLRNNITVATDSIDGFETVSVGLFINVGSVNENDMQVGLSHFVEHMAFKGTTSRTASQISGAIESVGGFINAYTGKESTAFWVRLLKTDIELAVDIITDIVQNSVFDAEEFEKERGVIVQEIRQLNDVPGDLIFDMFQEKCFEGERLGTQILGEESDIMSYCASDLKEYMNSKYSPDKMIMCASGGINHDDLVCLTEKFSDKMRKLDVDVIEKQTYKGGYIFKKKKLEQTHLVIGFEGLSHNSDERFRLGVLSNILGGGMSSRLFQEVREKMGLVYSIFSFDSNYVDTGTFGVYAACEDSNAKDVVSIVMDEFMKIKVDITDEEVQKAKTQMRASILMSLESSMSRMQRLAGQLMFRKRYISPSEITQKIDEVTIESVKNVADTIFNAKPTLAALGNCDEIEKLYETCS